MTADLAWGIACAVFLLGMAGLIGVAVWDHRNCPKCYPGRHWRRGPDDPRCPLCNEVHR